MFYKKKSLYFTFVYMYDEKKLYLYVDGNKKLG